ncbi:hypothetical protein NVP1084O_109 [Vibrio phage 1.084.O._10N.261.49.F5]|nr:hypothetical protein NVP1084O_109 [Vibrio phage 1.084.O._10N.261.49.F5]
MSVSVYKDEIVLGLCGDCFVSISKEPEGFALNFRQGCDDIESILVSSEEAEDKQELVDFMKETLNMLES